MEKRESIYHFKSLNEIKNHYLKYIPEEKYQAALTKIKSTFKKRKDSTIEENLLDFLAAIDNEIFRTTHHLW